VSSPDVTARRPGAARAWLEIARISNTPTVVSNTVAGAVLVSTAPDGVTVALVAVAMALFYTAGMVLNDIADAEIDRRDRPERPIPSGAISPRAASTAFAALIGAGVALLAAQGWRPLLAGLILVALIVAYDFWHKGNALSPVLMAACRALVYVVAALAIADALNDEVWGAAAMLLVYVVGLTQVAKAEGSGIAARWPVVAVLAPAIYWAKELPDTAVALLIVAFVVWAGYALWLVLAQRQIGAGVVRLIAGIAIYDALVVAGAGGDAVALSVCLAAFAATIALQTKIAGT
jgi:heme O synthase-like polyprenyltransferase